MIRILAVIGMVSLLTGCLSVEVSPTAPPLTPTASLTPLPSATIIWFPATATYTPFPTQVTTPTQEMLSGLGEIIVKDSFTAGETWDTSRTAAGSVAFGLQELTLAVAAPQTFLSSQRRSLQLYDFYLEIDVLPSLCLAKDAYGLLLRASSAIDYYRLLVTCDGQLRMERLKNGKPVILQDWMNSGQIFPGGMMRSRLGVWALGEEMRVFVNGVYHFSVRDPVWRNGQVGVFARSAGDTPLTVSFSNLLIFDLIGGQPIPAISTPRPGSSSTPVRSVTPTRSP